MNIKAYLNSSIVTTIETSNAPLKEAIFPSLTVCNFNQLEASFMKELGIYGNKNLTDLLLKEFMIGRQENLTEFEMELLKEIKAKLKNKRFEVLHF